MPVQTVRTGGAGQLLSLREPLLRWFGVEEQESEEETAADDPDARWRSYSYEELAARDKISLDIFASTRRASPTWTLRPSGREAPGHAL